MNKPKLIMIVCVVVCIFMVYMANSVSSMNMDDIQEMSSINNKKRVKTSSDIALYKEGVFTVEVKEEGEGSTSSDSNSSQSYDPSVSLSPTTDDIGAKIIETARAQIGKPYYFGATGPDSFDCSGLVFYCYTSVGLSVPRVSASQANAGIEVSEENAVPGDIVCFGNPGVHHAGLYIGNNKMIHAPSSGKTVTETTMDWHKQHNNVVVFRHVR